MKNISFTIKLIQVIRFLVIEKDTRFNLRQIIGNMIGANDWSLYNMMLQLQLKIINDISMERESPIKYLHD